MGIVGYNESGIRDPVYNENMFTVDSSGFERKQTKRKMIVRKEADYLFGIKFPRCMNPRGLLHTQITIDAMMINNSLISSL